MRFEIRAGHETAFDDLVRSTVQEICRHEPGTLVHATHEVEGSPQARVFYELYRDRAAFDEHERQDHVRAFRAAREEHVASTAVDLLRLGPAKPAETAR